MVSSNILSKLFPASANNNDNSVDLKESKLDVEDSKVNGINSSINTDINNATKNTQAYEDCLGCTLTTMTVLSVAGYVLIKSSRNKGFLFPQKNSVPMSSRQRLFMKLGGIGLFGLAFWRGFTYKHNKSLARDNNK